MSDDTGPIDLLQGIAAHASREADKLDHEATKLEQEAHDKRMRAFALRAHARVQEKMG